MHTPSHAKPATQYVLDNYCVDLYCTQNEIIPTTPYFLPT